MIKLVEGKQKKYLESLCQELHYTLPTPIDEMAKEVASKFIDELLKLKKKESNYYADKGMIGLLAKYCQNNEIFKAFKEDCLQLPEFIELRRGNALSLLEEVAHIRPVKEVLAEYKSVTQLLELALDKLDNDKEIERLERQQDQLIREGKIARQLAEGGQAQIDKWKDTVKRIDDMEQELNEYKDKIDNWIMVKDVRLNNDIVKSFINNNATRYNKWQSVKATDDQIRAIINLERTIQGNDVIVHYANTLTKKFAETHIQKLQKEVTMKHTGFESQVNRQHRAYSNDNIQDCMQWDVESDNKWASLIHQVETLLGFTIEVERDNLLHLKQYIDIAKFDNEVDYIVETIEMADYSLGIKDLNALGLLPMRRIRNLQGKREETLSNVKDLIELKIITKEEIAKLIG